MIRRAQLAAAGEIMHGSTVDTGFGVGVDCANWSSFILNPAACWGRSREAWQQMRQFDQAAQSLPIPPPAAAVPLATTGQATYAGSAADVLRQYNDEIDAVTKDAADAERRAIQAWAWTVPEVQDSSETDEPGFWTKYKFWLIGAAAAVAIVAVTPAGRRR